MAAVLTIGVFLEARETTRSAPMAQTEAGEEFAHAVVEEFLSDVAWLIPVVAAAALLIAILSVRDSLRPLREVSSQASKIGPRDTAVCLKAVELPSEIVALVCTLNQALDRLEASSNAGLPRMLRISCAHRWQS